ncbi:signal transduction histidine kinase [Paenibacillus taihuensis]|uniref:histidine kinase n=1 Tax=Paenibacillus taihuensis TaxID=1156355 RepID=A0A3D9SCS0_9BACL|nr:HAMP domain-containing sensor histidine kinase [Paenibacillus taihuensis]REE91681.1 signal transduction histidine kinase [Paenibacillus taihuensis]
MRLNVFIRIFLIITSIFTIVPIPAGASTASADSSISSWQIKWETKADQLAAPDQALKAAGWQDIQASDPAVSKPEHAVSAWIRIKLPVIEKNQGMFFHSIYAQNITIFLGGEEVYHSERKHWFDLNRVLIPLENHDSGQELVMHLESQTDRLGLGSENHISDYQDLMRLYAKFDLLDIILGGAFVFVAFVMLVCSVFLDRNQLKSWLSLCFIILPIGGLLIGYSPFLYTFYGKYGFVYQAMFDLSLYLFLPSLMMFFELLFGSGYRGIVKHFRQFQIAYSIFGIIAMTVNWASGYTFQHYYFFVSVTFIGVIMLAQFILILIILVRQLWNRNIDSIILSIGLAVFASVSVAELLKFYASSKTYDLSWWKWGLVAFVLSLIVLLGRRFSYQHKLIMTYSRDLEIYNSELQRSEKMEIISQLAASVAHEVRNPLQVTRGLLQLLEERHKVVVPNTENYYKLAIDELDRASTIITDFLTFAKPQMEQVHELNLAEEFKHVEGIIVPLANLQGGHLEMSVPRSLRIMGNSSKLKQALVNIIKNSIEALEGSGVVKIWAYEEHEQVVIHIADSGAGMDERILERLGEPYFTNKNKGTGLGLMVTFRIIEVMQGTIKFKSQKGVGTEAMIRFPAAR